MNIFDDILELWMYPSIDIFLFLIQISFYILFVLFLSRMNIIIVRIEVEHRVSYFQSL